MTSGSTNPGSSGSSLAFKTLLVKLRPLLPLDAGELDPELLSPGPDSGDLRPLSPSSSSSEVFSVGAVAGVLRPSLAGVLATASMFGGACVVDAVSAGPGVGIVEGEL